MTTPNGNGSPATPTASNMIEPGVYKAKPLATTWVELVEQARAEASGQCSISFEVIEGPFKGHSLPWFGSWKEGEAFEITKKALDGMSITFATDGSPDLSALADEVRIGVIHKPQQKYVDGKLEAVLVNGQPKMMPSVNWVGGGAYTAKAVTDPAKIADHRKRIAGSVAKAAATSTVEGLPTGADGRPAF